MSVDANTSEVWNLREEIEARWPAPKPSRLRRFPYASIIFGVLAPLGCLALQPVLADEPALQDLFRDRDAAYQLLGLGYFNAYWIFGYGFLSFEMLALVVRLAFGRRLGAWNGAIASVLGVGVMFAALQGAVLLPLSIIGLFFGIGILGFVPFATMMVFAINANRALTDAFESAGAVRVLCMVVIGALLVIGLPLAAQWPLATEMESALDKTASGDPTAIEPFERWTRLALKQRVLDEWERERNPERKECFDQAYKRLTGVTASERQQRIDAD